jgi:hypothetical protein
MRTPILKSLLLLSCIFLISFSHPANAAKPAHKAFKIAAPLEEGLVPVLTDAEYEKMNAETKGDIKARNIAAEDRLDYATLVDDDFKNLTADLVGGTHWADKHEKANSKTAGVKTPEKLAEVIADYEGRYNNLSNGAKIVTAQLIALKPFRGILYRLRPLAEAQHTPFIHGMIISYLRGVNAGINNLFPSEQWKAGFEYISKPYPGMGKQIFDEQDFYDYIAKELRPSVGNLSNRISALKLTQPVYLDNKIFWANANFVSDHDRFVTVGITEKYAYMSAIYFSLASINNALAYDWTDLFKATQSYWTLYGFNTAFARQDNMTAKQRTDKIRTNRDLFTRLPNAATLTAGHNGSYDYFIAGLRMAKMAWNRIKGEVQDHPGQASPGNNNSFNYAIDSRGFAPFVRVIDTSFLNVDSLVHENGVASAVVNGEVAEVNFKKLFTDPPADLKDFLPTHFLGGETELTDTVTHLTYRNYSRENPDGWNYTKFTPYFPQATDPEGLKRTIRVLNQSWGGAIIGFPLATVLF